MMPFPMKASKPTTGVSCWTTIALGSRPHAVEVPAPPTMEPSDSYDPIVHLDWQTRAACRVWIRSLFPTGGNAIGHLTRICARCPVAEECRTTALMTRHSTESGPARPYGSVAVCEVKKELGGDEPARSIRRRHPAILGSSRDLARLSR